QAAEQNRKDRFRRKSGAEHESAESDEQAEEWNHRPSRRTILRGGGERAAFVGGQHVLRTDDRGDARDAGANTGRVVAVLERRRELLANDVTGEPIRQNRLETVADL